VRFSILTKVVHDKGQLDQLELSIYSVMISINIRSNEIYLAFPTQVNTLFWLNNFYKSTLLVIPGSIEKIHKLLAFLELLMNCYYRSSKFYFR